MEYCVKLGWFLITKIDIRCLEVDCEQNDETLKSNEFLWPSNNANYMLEEPF